MTFDTFNKSSGISDAVFAKRAGITPGTLNAWRTGKSVPAPGELIDIATRFHTTVADLLGNAVLDPLPMRVPRMAAIRYDGPNAANNLQRWIARRHAHFSYIGLSLPDHDTERFYPVDSVQYTALLGRDRLTASGLAPIKTRNGKVLAVRYDGFLSSFTEEGCWQDDDAPVLGWDGMGLPPEVYRAMAAAVATDANTGTLSYSAAMQKQVEAALECLGSKDPAVIREALELTIVHYLDGRVTRLRAVHGPLRAAVRAIELGALTIFLEDADTHAEHLFVLEGVAAIEMPLHQVEVLGWG